MDKPVVFVNNWALRRANPDDPYGEPYGYIEGNLQDGKAIRTERIVHFSEDGTQAETTKTIYRLGCPEPTYKDWLKKQGLICDGCDSRVLSKNLLELALGMCPACQKSKMHLTFTDKEPTI